MKPVPFGKYYLLDRIHAGGMAEVFRAKAFGVEGFERIVAVKRILPSVAADTDFIRVFIDEAKIAVQLSHANIAQIFDLGKVGEAYFVALEYVHGKDLRAVAEGVPGGAVPVEMACYVIMKTCEGLDYAHNKRDAAGSEIGLVHRDVSPQNILVSFDGEAKLIDFGIAGALGGGGSGSRSQAGLPKSKLGYLSPEQVSGAQLDRGSDIFSVGIVLHELLTGQRLFTGANEFVAVEKLRQIVIPKPSAGNPTISGELDAIVMKALSRERSDRYQTAMELHDDLQRFLYGRDASFGRRELSAFMREHFAVEAALDQEAVGDLRDVEVVATSENTDVGPTLEPAEPIAVNRDNSGNPNKKTMLGMPATFPQGGAGRSVPPPPPRGGGSPSMAPGQGRSVPPPPPRSAPPPPEPVRSVPPAPPSAPRASIPPGPPSTQGRAQSMAPGQMAAQGRAQSVAPGQMAVPVGAVSASIPSVTSPSSPPGASRSMPPPPPGQGYVSSPAPSTGTALGYAPPSSAVLRMDWDDEELSTQIYDRPEEVQVGDNPYGAYEDPQAGYASQQQFHAQNDVETYAPATLAAPVPSPFDAPPAQPAARSAGTSRAAQVTQPIVTHSGSPEKNRGRMFAGLAVAAVAVLCVMIYVFLAKTEPGVVQLTTHPLDAQVLFDGKPVGTASPFIVTGVAPNENHLIEVKKAGYTSWSQEVQVQPGQTLQLPVGLELAMGGTAGVASTEGTAVQTGAFSLETVPPGAKVFLDGQELGGVTPLRVGNLAPRRYDVRVRLDGFREATLPVEVRGGVDQSLSRVVLDALQVRARITSEPPNADVELSRGDDRRPVGKTPVDVTLDNNGTPWVLSVSKSGFEEYRETLNTQSGSADLAVRATLMRSAGGASASRPAQAAPPRARPSNSGGGGSSTAASAPTGGTGTLRLNSRPWAQVFVDGKSIGNTPQMNVSLPAGQHKITLVNPEFRLRKNLTVTIKAGEVQTQIVSLQ